MMASAASAVLPCDGWAVRASSVLRRDATQYGPKHVLTDSEDCWNSDQGTPQWIQIEFPRPVKTEAVVITFQGGFVGQEGQVLVSHGSAGAPAIAIATFEPDDINKPQTFPAVADGVTKMRVVFGRSSDLFGRVMIYSLRVQGSYEEVPAHAAAPAEGKE